MRQRLNGLVLSFFFLSLCPAGLGCATPDDDEGTGAPIDQDADAGTVRDALDITPPTPDAVTESDGGIGGDDLAVEEPEVSEPDIQQEPELPDPICGGLGEPCCEGESCDGELECWDGTCAEPSGCPDDPACLDPPTSYHSVSFTMQTGLPPTLSGGTIIDGAYEMTAVDIYADNTFTELVTTVNISDNGGTAGALEFQGPDWGFYADLDLDIYIYAVVLEFPQYLVQPLYAAGCYTIDGNRLESDITQCGGMWPEGSEPPEYLEFEASGDTVKFLLVLTRETIMASVPEEDQWAADMALTEEGDLPLIFSFEAMD